MYRTQKNGVPNPGMRAEAQSAAAVEERGIAYSQRKERSITVRRYV